MGEKEGKEALLIRELLILGDDYAELRVPMLFKMFLLLHGQWLTCQVGQCSQAAAVPQQCDHCAVILVK